MSKVYEIVYKVTYQGNYFVKANSEKEAKKALINAIAEGRLESPWNYYDDEAKVIDSDSSHRADLNA